MFSLEDGWPVPAVPAILGGRRRDPGFGLLRKRGVMPHLPHIPDPFNDWDQAENLG